MSLQALLNNHQRSLILQALAEDVDYKVSDQVLQTVLEALGENISLDSLHTHVAWLQEQSLVTLETIQKMQIATLTGRGLDVAKGRVKQPGVARPRPE